MKKLLIIIFISTIFIYFIYMINHQSKLNILSIGDIYSNGYNNAYFPSYNDYYKDYLDHYDNYDLVTFNNASEAFYSINENKEMNGKAIKKMIKDANLIILNIGIEELNNSDNIINSNYINKYLNNYEQLLKAILKINNKIIIINLPRDLYLNDKYRLIINDYIDGLVNKYNLSLIDVRNEPLDNINILVYQVLMTQKLTS